MVKYPETITGSSVRRQWNARVRARVQYISVGVTLASALGAVVLFSLLGRAETGGTAIDQVKEAVEPVLSGQQRQAESSGGRFDVTWSASPMSGGQMVEVAIRSSVASQTGRALFMVDDATGDVVAQDPRAAELLGPDAKPMPHG